LLPDAIGKLLNDGLAATYDVRLTAPLPDLQTGYSRLLRHLQLLASFELPPSPTPLSFLLEVRKASDPDAFPPVDTGVKPVGSGKRQRQRPARRRRVFCRQRRKRASTISA